MGKQKKAVMMAGFFAVILAMAAIVSGPVTASERFVDNGDGTVLDTETGLAWTQDANMAGQLSWDEAVTCCEGLGNGWRLPTLGELETLLDMVALEAPMLPAKHPFVNAQSAEYWTISTYEEDGTSYAWYVDIVDPALSDYQHKDVVYYVWPVREDL